MMLQQLLLWCMLVLPWLSLFFIPKDSMRRFMPVSVLASLLVTIVFQYGYLYGWWSMHIHILPSDAITSAPLVYGFFPVVTLWIFHFCYDRGFTFYILVNTAMQALHCFIVIPLLVRIGLTTFYKITPLNIFVQMIGLATAIYLYQKWQDKAMATGRARAR